MSVLMCATNMAIALQQATPRPAEILTEVRALLDAPQTPEPMARIDALLQQVRLLEDSRPELPLLDVRFGMHTEMLDRYRAAGDWADVRRHAEWLVAFEHGVGVLGQQEMPVARPRAREMPNYEYRREVRARHAAAFLTARLIWRTRCWPMATATRRWLETGEKRLADIRGAVKALRAERDRIRKGGPPRLGGGRNPS